MSLARQERPPGWALLLVLLVVAGMQEHPYGVVLQTRGCVLSTLVEAHTRSPSKTGSGGDVCARRALQQSSTAPTYCLYEDDFATWTTNNCFRVCLQATMGGNLNFYDFSWNFSTALTDLTFLNPSAAQQVQLNRNTQMLAACYDRPLPSKALGACVTPVLDRNHHPTDDMDAHNNLTRLAHREQCCAW